jgi:GNAT superfamily N-acetyltransferase
VASWLEIVREVESLFGPMPDFESALLRNISRGTALCARDVGGQVLGGVLLRGAPRTQISWLAVRPSARRRGVGRALVTEALCRLPAGCEVVVDTASGAGCREIRAIWRKLDCLNPSLRRVEPSTCRKDARNRYRPLRRGVSGLAVILWGAGAMPCQGIEGDERDA